MKLLMILTLAICTGCAVNLDQPAAAQGNPPQTQFQKEYPTVNLPIGLRQQNWVGNQGEGSCVHASMVMLFRWQGRYAMADWWRRNNQNGEWASDLAMKLDFAGVRYAYTSQRGDVGFLEWACRTRRGCAVTVMGGRHMVCLVHLDDKWAGILDNNHINRIKWVPRQTFIAEWLNSTSWAVTPVYTPAPPLP